MKINLIMIVVMVTLGIQALEIRAGDKNNNILLDAWSDCSRSHMKSRKESLGQDIATQCGETPNDAFQSCFLNIVNSLETEGKEKCRHLKPDFIEMIAMSKAEKNGVSVPDLKDKQALYNFFQQAAIKEEPNTFTSSELISAIGSPSAAENSKTIEKGSIYIYKVNESHNIKVDLINKLVQRISIKSIDGTDHVIWPAN